MKVRNVSSRTRCLPRSVRRYNAHDSAPAALPPPPAFDEVYGTHFHDVYDEPIPPFQAYYHHHVNEPSPFDLDASI